MPLLNLFIALFYLSLLLTTEAGHAHDQRLSPLADSQFQALTQQTPTYNYAVTNAEPEPDEAEVASTIAQVLSIINLPVVVSGYAAPWLAFTSSPDTARAPPALLHI